MRTNISSLLIGLIFAIGLGISGMTNPERIIGFLDIFGDWNPSLIFVMLGALAVHAPLYRMIRKTPAPIFAKTFQVPIRTDITFQLILGSILFGIGWGLIGYCPAPAITAMASLSLKPILFVGAMLVGMMIYRSLERVIEKRQPTAK